MGTLLSEEKYRRPYIENMRSACCSTSEWTVFELVWACSDVRKLLIKD